MDITGRKLFVKALQEEGVDTIFGYPGGTVTDLFDELYKTDSRKSRGLSCDERTGSNQYCDRSCGCTL